MSGAFSIAEVTAADVDELLPLMRAYCDFYETSPSDAALRELALTQLEQPQLEGVQLLAREQGSRRAIAFASLFWSWDTTEASRIAIMNDLWVDPAARGSGVAPALIEACLERARGRGASRLEWETAPGNARARALYERVGATLEEWVVYSLQAQPR